MVLNFIWTGADRRVSYHDDCNVMSMSFSTKKNMSIQHNDHDLLDAYFWCQDDLVLRILLRDNTMSTYSSMFLERGKPRAAFIRCDKMILRETSFGPKL